MRTDLHLGDLADIVRGVSFDKDEAADLPAPNRLPILRAGNIQESLLVDQGLVFVPEKRVSAGQLLRRGDIAICMSSGSSEIVGKTAVLGAEWRGSVGVFCAIIRPRDGIAAPGYIAAWLKSPVFRAWTRRSEGVNIKNIRRSELEGLPVRLPTMREQRRIVDILDRAASICRLRRQAQETARQIIPALFVKMFGEPATNPMGWPVAPLDAVADVASGVTKGRRLNGEPTVDVPYLRVANVQDGFIDLNEVKTIPLRPTEIDRFRVLPGDMLMTEGGDPDKLGRGAIWTGELDYCAHQNHIFRVRPDRRRLRSQFLSLLAGSAYGKSYFLKVAKRTTGIASINKTQLSRFPVLLPPIRAQEDFERRVSAIRRLIEREAAAVQHDAAIGAALAARLLG